MAKKKAIPPIHVPIQTASGAMDFSWYMFMQWLAESATQSDLSNYFTKEETEELLSAKVDIVSEPSKIYGTDEDGNQYLYSVSYFAVDNDVVHKSGNETINNTKTFTGTIVSSQGGSALLLKRGNSTFVELQTQLSDGTRTGGFRNIADHGNTTYMYVADGGDFKGSINIVYDGTSVYTSAPTPTNLLDNSTKIATTAWVNNYENTQRTNCITEVSQDIKLELSNGTLTLKAGSKVYVPNGVGVFDKITIASDVSTSSFGGASTDLFFFYRPSNNSLYYDAVVNTTSGTTMPSGTGTFYNTSANTVHYYSSGVDSGINWSFPLCIITRNNGTPTGIQQVFNGFGYIGSTVFVLPGVKGLMPNYRNTDGTLKNINVNVTSVQTKTQTFNAGYYYVGFASSAGVLGFYGVSVTKYDEARNVVVDTYANVDRAWTTAGALIYSDTNHKITSFKKSEAFHAVDYSDLKTLSDTVSANDLAAVHKAGTETITGLKTFKQAYSRIAYMINSTINLSSTPSSDVHAFIDFVDGQTTPVRIGVMGARQTTDGWYGTYMQAGNQGSIGIATDGTNVRTSAPTPSSANDNSTKMATTAWVNNHENIQRTNCVVQIPQDINLELNNGTLTLKAGSKVYVPNGSGTFKTVTIASDLTMSGGTATGTELVYLTASASALYHYRGNSSGTNWTATQQYECRYNTSDNLIKNTNNTGSTWLTQLSFPIAKITLSSGTVTSIDQVFNGFGYIGSTVFVLPGVKGLMPNYRNTDGTLKNINVNVTSVQTKTQTFNAGYYYVGFASSAGVLGFYGVSVTKYDEARNVVVDTYTNVDRAWTTAGALIYSDTNHKITSFKKSEAFHAVDYSDTSVDFVVANQLPTSSNNYTWYRKYKSGWVEQGGTYSWSGNGEKGPVNLPIAMSDTHYQIMMTTAGTDVDGSDTTTIYSRTTSSFNIGAYASSRQMVWEVKGMAA